MRTWAVAYFMMLGYLAKKYEIPAKVGDMILEGVRVVGTTAGASYAEGLTAADTQSIFRSLDEQRDT